MHNHNKCEHKLEFCKHCDVVFCQNCKEEWKKNNSWVYTGVTTTPSYPIVTCESINHNHQ